MVVSIFASNAIAYVVARHSSLITLAVFFQASRSFTVAAAKVLSFVVHLLATFCDFWLKKNWKEFSKFSFKLPWRRLRCDQELILSLFDADRCIVPEYEKENFSKRFYQNVPDCGIVSRNSMNDSTLLAGNIRNTVWDILTSSKSILCWNCWLGCACYHNFHSSSGPEMKLASGTGERKDDLEQFEARYLAPTVCDHGTRKILVLAL